MRSQASKGLAKKGGKTTQKLKSPTSQVKKKIVVLKKVNNLVKKTLAKKAKTKSDVSDVKSSDDSSSGEKTDSDSSKISTPKSSPVKTESPNKRPKKDEKKKKVLKHNKGDTKTKTKKSPSTSKTLTKTIKKNKSNTDDAKYKINPDIKLTQKISKTKALVKKKILVSSKKKIKSQVKQDECEKVTMNSSDTSEIDSNESNPVSIIVSGTIKEFVEPGVANKTGISSDNFEHSNELSSNENTSKIVFNDTPKIEPERAPKFFTSSRSPRMVDIDVKCIKTSKGNLSVSERFLSLKCGEPKADEMEKDKNSLSNNLVSQGPEIDVYTFTEKVDSPKNILSDFRNPINKNIGRVRPIARVKGTVIDSKNDAEKKKFSPHRPIEEVVKQLKANKRSEELKLLQNQRSDNISSADEAIVMKDENDDFKPIISKSYKMVARKSSITGKPFSPIKFLETEESKSIKNTKMPKKTQQKSKTKSQKNTLSDDELDNSKFSFNTKNTSLNYSSSEESMSDSADDNDMKESTESESYKKETSKKTKKYKKITESTKKKTSKELKELSKDSLVDLKDDDSNEKPNKRRLKLMSMWSGPKKHRMASLNAIAKVHCLYENESRTHLELGLMKTVDRVVIPGISKPSTSKKKEPKQKEVIEKQETTSESEYERKDKKEESSEEDSSPPSTRKLRGEPGIRSAGKYWDPKSCTSSSESEMDSKKKYSSDKKKIPTKISSKSDTEKPPAKMKKTAGVPVKKKRNRNEVVMDLKDMVVQKRMASLNATAILAASYEKRSPKSNKDETTSDSCSDESFFQKSKNGLGSGVKSEAKPGEPKKEKEEAAAPDRKQKVEVIVNQDTDVTITGVYATHHHEGFCTVSGMQYRISSTSHTQTTATSNCEKEGCSREEARYTPLSALSSMQPPADHSSQPVAELGGLGRRPGCSSAFSAPSPSAHHDPGYYQPAGPLIKESGAEERALARYHAPHYHTPHPPLLPQYGPYYPPELCYSRYYRPGGYHLPPPAPDAQMVGVGSEPYPSPQYYGAPPCYQHSPQRVPFIEYRGCPCPMNSCPKNVLIGPATGKAATGGGPGDAPPLAPGACFRKLQDAHAGGKDPPLEAERPAERARAALGGASPKREPERPAPEPPGPPSPARGSAGACAPQPPPAAPRRARLGKAMARRSLVGDDTNLLLAQPRPGDDDDVLAVSPPLAAPIDLSADEPAHPPLLDVKKENEGPTYASPRKPDAQALKENNTAQADAAPNSAKATKRRYSKTKLEIDFKDMELEDGCKTNGIGEHVKLQKRRKVSSEQIETSTRPEPKPVKETKKKASPRKEAKKSPKATTVAKRPSKRKADEVDTPPEKRANVDATDTSGEERLAGEEPAPVDPSVTKSKIKSALLLDNLLRKNSIDRPDTNNITSNAEINPAELFLTPNDKLTQSCTKKSLNINNNVIDKVNNGNQNAITAVSQLIGKKLVSTKTSNKKESKVATNNKSLKALNAASDKTDAEDSKTKLLPSSLESKDTKEKPSVKTEEKAKPNAKTGFLGRVFTPTKIVDKILAKLKFRAEENEKRENASKVTVPTEAKTDPQEPVDKPPPETTQAPEKVQPEKVSKRSRLSLDKANELKSKSIDKANEKVAKLMVSKKSVIKTDEAALLVEEACASPVSVRAAGRRGRRRSGARRTRKAPTLLMPSLSDLSKNPPKWSNGWKWDGEPYISKVSVNNDTRQDVSAACWSRMVHAGGDCVARGDCVLLRAGRGPPYVARVCRLWQSPTDGEMMVSLVWYYRPEHTERGRTAADAPDEVFASRHRDANSVACIEDKCYVLTYNEYCRYRKRLKAQEDGVVARPSPVPAMPAAEVAAAVATNDGKLPRPVAPDLVLFCRKIYDYRSKKIQVPNK